MTDLSSALLLHIYIYGLSWGDGQHLVCLAAARADFRTRRGALGQGRKSPGERLDGRLMQLSKLTGKPVPAEIVPMPFVKHTYYRG